MNRMRLVPLLAALCALLLVPAAANAADQDVWDAYSNSKAAKRVANTGERFADAFERVADKATRRRLRAAGRASRALNRAVIAHLKAVKRPNASTADGKRGKALLVKELTAIRKASTLAARGCRAALNDNRDRAARLFDRAADALRRATKYSKRGRRAFREAGIDTSQKRAASAAAAGAGS